MDVDFILIRKMKQGEKDAFDLFIHKYYGKILNYCGYHCFDRAMAEDLTQETFLRFFENLTEFHSMGKSLNYLYTIAGNLCRDYYRKKKQNVTDGFSEEMKEKITNERTDEIINKIIVEEAIEKLPDELKEVIILYYFQGCKLLEISNILHIGLPLVKYRLRQARMKLKEIMKDGEYGEC